MLDMNSYMLANCIFDAEPTLKHVAAAYAHEEQQTKSICGNAKPSRVQQSARDRRVKGGSARQEEMPDQESPDQELTAYVWETKHIKIKTLSSDVFWISVQSHLIGSVVWFGINLEKTHLTFLNNGNSAEMVTVRPQGRQRECVQTRTRQMTNAKTSTRQEK